MMVELDKTKLAIDSNEIIEPAKPEPKPLEPLEQVPVETLQQIKNVEPTQSLISLMLATFPPTASIVKYSTISS